MLLSNKQSKRRSVYEFDDSPRSLKQGSLNGVAPEIGQEGTQFGREARKNSGVLKRFSCVFSIYALGPSAVAVQKLVLSDCVRECETREKGIEFMLRCELSLLTFRLSIVEEERRLCVFT